MQGAPSKSVPAEEEAGGSRGETARVALRERQLLADQSELAWPTQPRLTVPQEELAVALERDAAPVREAQRELRDGRVAREDDEGVLVRACRAPSGWRREMPTTTVPCWLRTMIVELCVKARIVDAARVRLWIRPTDAFYRRDVLCPVRRREGDGDGRRLVRPVSIPSKARKASLFFGGYFRHNIKGCSGGSAGRSNAAHLCCFRCESSRPRRHWSLL